jgi:prepilin-type N-terminal cleavage/methylation domain-containing protein
MKTVRHHRAGFTLIELMMVVAIMIIACAMAFPAISTALHRAPLTQAVMDMTEGCRKARALAILQDHPMELDIFSDGRLLVASAQLGAADNIEAAPPPQSHNSAIASASAEVEPPKPLAGGGFSAQLPDTVAVELIDVNFVDYMGADLARVRFYPNGTCDEFTVVLKKDNERRKISLEVVTGLSQVDAM